MPSSPTRRRFLAGVGLLGAAPLLSAADTFSEPADPSLTAPAQPRKPAPAPRQRPNILLITADDMDGHTPGAFADHRSAHGVTPHLDKLARRGMTFHRPHVVVAVCQPSRSAIMTGLLPHHNGAVGFDPIHSGVDLLTDVLRRHGYLNGILGKVGHLQPVRRFRWDLIKQATELGQGRSPRLYRAAAAQFFDRAAREKRPWFLMANSHDPHRPFSGSADERAAYAPATRRTIPAPSKTFDADQLKPPGFLPDLAPVRQEYAQYLGSARRCDDTVGALLEELQLSGQAENTMIIFLSDNGMSFPFAKSNCYLRSTLTPLIISRPGHIAEGARSQAFVSSLDLFPTICDAIGATVPNSLDGRSLTPLLHDHDQPHRDHVFTVYHDITPKNRYEMRCLQDARYGYIWNAWSDGKTRYRAENMEGLTWSAMLDASHHDPQLAQRIRFYQRRVPEELYDLERDPGCLTNLVHRPAVRTALKHYRAAMHSWLHRQHDPLASRYDRLLT